MTSPIVFLTDYGMDDEFVGICHGVMARIAPETRVVDLMHAVPARDVLRGALELAQSIRYMPDDAIFLGVVDPGVGTPRRGIAVSTASGRALVGPDNGLLSLAWQALGGVAEAVEITSPEVVLSPPSATFHGRDVFAPAAAHLAAGMVLAGLGDAIDPASLAVLEVPKPRIGQGELATRVLSFDHFGNVQLAARGPDLEAAGLAEASAFSLHASGSAHAARRAATFGDVETGALALIVDSLGWLEVVVNGGSAAAALSLEGGDAVTITRHPDPVPTSR